MKFTIKPENLHERIAFTFNLAPTPLLDTQVAFTAARAIMAASVLGIFEAMDKKSKTYQQIASETATNPRAAKQLLDCLVGIGYVQWNNGNYSLKPKYHKWLLKENESNLTGKLRFQLLEWNWMSMLEEYVKTGKSIDMHSHLTSEEWASYQDGMRDISINASKEMAEKLKLPSGATTMIDIGGSHGLYSIALCRKYPMLTSTILELPGAVDRASVIASRYNMTDRIKYKSGNALTDDLGENVYNLVMINNVVHHFTETENKELSLKIARALKPGGIYAIGEIIRLKTPGEGGILGAVTGLYFSMTSSSGTWSLEDIQSWQKNAGLKIGKPITYLTVPGHKLVIAYKN